MTNTQTTESGVELDSVQKQHLRDIAKLDTNLQFIKSILDADGSIAYELERVVINFDREKGKYTLKLKSKGMLFETTASPDLEEFNDWIKKFITATAENLTTAKREQEDGLAKYNEERGVDMFAVNVVSKKEQI